MRASALFFLLPLLLVVCVSGVLIFARAEEDCTITLGTDPEPPECIANPGGTVTIFWTVEYSTTPDFVYYQLRDPDGNTVEDEFYPGDSGINISRDWTVPEGSQDGSYWVRVEYWSEEVGVEGVAEVVFLVCSGTPSEGDTWGGIKGLFR